MHEIVQRHRNVEMILELADQLEHTQRIEPQVRKQLTVQGRFDLRRADPFEDLEGVASEAIRGQASKCNTNVAGAPDR